MVIIRCTTLDALRRALTGWHGGGVRTALVPTMGALHEGHLSLVETAARHADKVAVSIFVNPLQFGPDEDFLRYPRSENEDVEKLESAGADLVFLPSVEDMYPGGFATSVTVAGLSEGLCGATRPGFFKGVATVVARLFGLVRPDVAVFGEKDYQQLQVIRAMVRDLAMGVEIIGAPVVRETDGLAMSSRNRYLGAEERKIAAQLYATLNAAAKRIRTGDGAAAALAWGRKTLRERGFSAVDYFELCDSGTLGPCAGTDRPCRLLAAAWLGETRLIDNIAFPA